MNPIDAVVMAAMDDEMAPFLAVADGLGEAVDVGGTLVRIGLVNAASSLAFALATREVRAVVSAGTAGGVARGVAVGDVVVGTEYAYASADATAFGYAPGQVPGMPVRYRADGGLRDAALAVPGVRGGLMVSGDAFIDAATVDVVRAAFPDALTADMESTALAQTCHRRGVPFVSVRAVSDLCGPDAGADFHLAVDDAAARSARVVLEVLRALPRGA
jgi:adenosylhomocysteine nucleosidase